MDIWRVIDLGLLVAILLLVAFLAVSYEMGKPSHHKLKGETASHTHEAGDVELANEYTNGVRVGVRKCKYCDTNLRVPDL